MRKILLASAGIIFSAGVGYAACIPTPSCSSLGYESSSSCEGGIKCPFGNAWNCTLVNKITEIEKIIQEGGASGNKGDTSNCVVGSIFYSDHTCSYGSLIQGKIPIGVVVQSDNAGHGQAMALNRVGGTMKWGGYGTDISTLQNFASDSAASKDLASCENTTKIIAAGDKSKYPAAWTAHEYKTVGTNAGDWCLPAAGIMTSINNNVTNINYGFNIAGGTQIETTVGYLKAFWSSSEKDLYSVWHFSYDSDYGLYGSTIGGGSSSTFGNKGYDYEVRPVLEF